MTPSRDKTAIGVRTAFVVGGLGSFIAGGVLLTTSVVATVAFAALALVCFAGFWAIGRAFAALPMPAVASQSSSPGAGAEDSWPEDEVQPLSVRTQNRKAASAQRHAWLTTHGSTLFTAAIGSR